MREEQEQKLETTEDTQMSESFRDEISEAELSSDLNEPRWSVVTFETRAAKNLTYSEAFEKMMEMEKQKLSGLCIITDEAAERLNDQ